MCDDAVSLNCFIGFIDCLPGDCDDRVWPHCLTCKSKHYFNPKYLAIDLFVVVISTLDYLHPSHLVGLTISQESCGGIAEAPSVPAAPQQQCDCFSCRPVLFYLVICFSCPAFGPPSRSGTGTRTRLRPVSWLHNWSSASFSTAGLQWLDFAL